MSIYKKLREATKKIDNDLANMNAAHGAAESPVEEIPSDEKAEEHRRRLAAEAAKKPPKMPTKKK